MTKGKIAVLIEEHFDPTEYRRFNEYFPAQGYAVEYVSYLWGNPSITFGSNPDNGTVDEHVTVEVDVTAIDPRDYSGILPHRSVRDGPPALSGDGASG